MLLLQLLQSSLLLQLAHVGSIRWCIQPREAAQEPRGTEGTQPLPQPLLPLYRPLPLLLLLLLLQQQQQRRQKLQLEVVLEKALLLQHQLLALQLVLLRPVHPHSHAAAVAVTLQAVMHRPLQWAAR